MYGVDQTVPSHINQWYGKETGGTRTDSRFYKWACRERDVDIVKQKCGSGAIAARAGGREDKKKKGN